jgi:hypothetical protein
MEVLLDGLDLLEGLLAWVIHASDKRNPISISLVIKCLHLLVADLCDDILAARNWLHPVITRFLASVTSPAQPPKKLNR